MKRVIVVFLMTALILGCKKKENSVETTGPELPTSRYTATLSFINYGTSFNGSVVFEKNGKRVPSNNVVMNGENCLANYDFSAGVCYPYPSGKTFTGNTFTIKTAASDDIEAIDKTFSINNTFAACPQMDTSTVLIKEQGFTFTHPPIQADSIRYLVKGFPKTRPGSSTSCSFTKDEIGQSFPSGNTIKLALIVYRNYSTKSLNGTINVKLQCTQISTIHYKNN